jgi:phage head maturation protease
MILAIDNPRDEARWRELARSLARAAALTDRAVSGAPALQARDVDYRQRQQQTEREARRELKALRDALAMMELD